MNALKVVAVASSEETRKALFTQLKGLDFAEFDGVCIELSDAARKAQAQHPDVIIVELTGREVDAGLFIQAISMNPEHPCVIFALHREMDIEVFKGAIKNGAKQFIQYPEDQLTLDTAMRKHLGFLERMSAQGQASAPAAAAREFGKIMTVYASKGGAGATMVAYNLAHEINEIHPEQVLLIDLDQFYCNSKLFRIDPEHSLGDVADSNPNEVDDGVFGKLVARHAQTKLSVMVACKDVFDENEMIPPELVERILDYACRHYRYIIVDLPSHVLDPYHQMMAERSDMLLLVSALDIPSLSRTRQYMDLAQKYLESNKLKLVLNRCNLKSAFSYSNQDLEAQFQTEPFARLMNDWELNVEASSKGSFLSQINPKADLSRNIRDLAESLSKQSLANLFNPAETGAPARKEAAGKENSLIGKLFGAGKKAPRSANA